MSALTASLKPMRRSEIDRALAAPRKRDVRYEVGHVVATKPDHPGSCSGPYRLTDVQREALLQVVDTGGRCLLSIGVGHGKTLVSLLAARLVGASRPLLLAPAGLLFQLEIEAAKMASSFRVLVPEARSYAWISTPGAALFLEEYEPDLLILDEAHKLKSPTSARTRRVLHYLGTHPDCRVVAMSGSFTTRSLKDFAHLLDVTLREDSPLPRAGSHELESWDRVARPHDTYFPEDVARCRPLLAAYRSPGAVRDQMRAALYSHLSTTRGVVMTTESAVKCSLVIRQRREPDVPDAVQALIRRVLDRVEAPDGEPLPSEEDALRVAKQLVMGFWYRWEWGDTPPKLRDEWLWRRSRWHRMLAAELKSSARPGYDSPALVAEQATGELAVALQRWREIEPEASPTPYAVWVSDYLVEDVARWARAQKRPALIWYRDVPFADRLEWAGVRVIRAGVEWNAAEELSRWRVHGAPVYAVSISAHGTGLNLQGFARQRVVAPPSNGSTWEQLLGRTHRLGQEADVVECEVDLVHPLARRAFAKARKDAEYIQATTGQAQKLAFASVVEGNDEV